VPPKRANPRALSRSINALSASRIRLDISCSPVSACALATSSSSSATVVRIFRPGGECAYAGCDCEGSLPDHFVLCSVRGCHCSGKLHPLPDERKADATETALLGRLRRLK
jgi:hypothetical protein